MEPKNEHILYSIKNRKPVKQKEIQPAQGGFQSALAIRHWKNARPKKEIGKTA